jgi:hypothetical protein
MVLGLSFIKETAMTDPHHGYKIPGLAPGSGISRELMEEIRRGGRPPAPEQKAAYKKFRRNFMLRLRLAVCLFLLFVGTVISCGDYASKHPHHLANLIPAALLAVALLVAITLLMMYRWNPSARR